MGRVAGVGADGAFDHIGATDPVDIGDVAAIADACEQRREVFQPLGNDMNDLAFALDLPAHAHPRGTEHNAAVRLENLGPDDKVREQAASALTGD